MEIFEMQQEFDELMKKGQALIKKLKENQSKKVDRWKPKVGEDYWFFENDGNLFSRVNYNSECDVFLKSIGNCFRTEEEAKKEFDRRLAEQELLDLCDWESGLDNLPSYIIYDTSDCEFYILNHKEVTYNPYRFANEDSARKAIEQLGTEKLKLIFRID